MHKHGRYKRQALDNITNPYFYVQRYKCTECKQTAQALPSFAAPYKHYILAIISEVLYLHFIVELCSYAVYTYHKNTALSYPTVREWLKHWEFNAPRLISLFKQPQSPFDIFNYCLTGNGMAVFKFLLAQFQKIVTPRVNKTQPPAASQSNPDLRTQLATLGRSILPRLQPLLERFRPRVGFFRSLQA